MSFLTPKHVEDAQRIFRGLLLVAGRAAAESRVVRAANRGGLQDAASEAFTAAKEQSQDAAVRLQNAANRMGAHPAMQQAGSQMEGMLQQGQAAVQQGVGQMGEQGNAIFRRSQSLGEQVQAQAGQLAQQLQGGGQQAQQAGQDFVQSGANNLQAAAKQVSQAAESQSRGQAPGEGDSLAAGLPQQPTGSQQAEASAAPLPRHSPADSSPVENRALLFSSEGGAAATSSSVDASLEQPAAAIQETFREPFNETNNAVPVMEPAEAGATGPPAASAVDVQMSEDPSPADRPGETQPMEGSSSEEDRLSDAEVQKVEEVAFRTAAAEASGNTQEARVIKDAAQPTPRQEREIERKKADVKRQLRERRVPQSQIGRAWGFAGLGMNLAMGAVSSSVGNWFGGPKPDGPDGKPAYQGYLTEQNAEKLADALCRMRGAALKLGQMISIQDENVLPPQFQAAMDRVRAGADIMPRKQLEQVLRDELGHDWQDKLADFEMEPMAAASIGQVHGATLKDGRRVAMKIQYPGVARSIESDVDNLMRIISLTNLLPKGLYVESAAKVAKRELAIECDYENELECQQRFARLINNDPNLTPHFHVPAAIPELSSARVLASEWVPGVHIDRVKTMPQAVRDRVGSNLLLLTLKELFEWRFMQTDPNWGNFLYDEATGVLNLIDFGAARDYPVDFVRDYMRMVKACAEKDREEVLHRSTLLGFLTGDESKVMMDAHTEAGFMVGEPFAQPGLYDFSANTMLTRRVGELGGVMMKHRLTAPPEEAYSLHRKLSGAFLACIKLGSRVRCRDIFYDTFEAMLRQEAAGEDGRHGLHQDDPEASTG
ncbi:hypothetical protein WJX74_001275 [Apatococcus lobatus]|uniref:ABC1 atypical kinase-like domain-containing protein n=1 Tax=Apatococcus lobatus TaxID=904363 RepID=A0AAW1RVD1_9CHLO